MAVSQDFWATREYLPQVAQGTSAAAPFNETHWPPKNAQGARFTKLIAQATAELNPQKHNELLKEAMQIKYEIGGYIIPYFSNQIDAYTGKMGGFVEAASGFPLGNYFVQERGIPGLMSSHKQREMRR